MLKRHLGNRVLGISAIPVLDATVKRLINILVIVVVVLWLLSAFGLLPH